MLCLEGDVMALRLVTLLPETEKTKSVLLPSLLERHILFVKMNFRTCDQFIEDYYNDKNRRTSQI